MQSPAHTNIFNNLARSGIPAFKLINDELVQVKELLDDELADCSEPVCRLVEHLNMQRGKMIRPGLVLLSYHAIGDVSREKKTQQEAIHIAAIAEMMHNATLLHDDVIDEGKKRRGLPTVNSLWGNESAVLLGDLLLSRVFNMCTNLEPRFHKILAAAAARTCKGELRQIIQRQNWQLSEPEYIDIITEKSAAFFSSCCRLGALLAGAGETEVELLADFGLNIGIAFQITDDLLDIVGDERKTGKASGNDAERNNLTLAVIHLLSTVDEGEKDMVKGKLTTPREGKEDLAEMLRCYGSLEYARSRAHEFVEKAIRVLAGLKESNAKDALIETARFITHRAV